MQPRTTSAKRDEIRERNVGVVPHDEDAVNGSMLAGQCTTVKCLERSTRRYRVTVLTSPRTLSRRVTVKTSTGYSDLCSRLAWTRSVPSRGSVGSFTVLTSPRTLSRRVTV